MLQYFTEHSRLAFVLAQEEAGKRGLVLIEPEHILLGILRQEDCRGAQVLAHSGVDVEKLRDELSTHRSERSAHAPLQQEMQLHPKSKPVIDAAYEEARLLNHADVGTDHLLLGLLHLDGGLAVEALLLSGIDRDKLRETVRNWQGESAEPRSAKKTEQSKKASFFEGLHQTIGRMEQSSSSDSDRGSEPT